jgi:hypothetical protein
MKRILFFLIFVAGTLTISAQDLIVTSAHDSINCKVKKVDQDNIYYSVNGQESIIALIKVKSCLYNYYLQKLPRQEVVPEEQEAKATSETTSSEDYDYKRFRFALNGGYSYRTFSISSGLTTKLTDYYKKLRWGFNASADATYFFNSKRGVGIKASVYKASNSADDICVFINGFLESGKISDDITILYVGPSITTRILGDQDWNSLFLTASVGYNRYINNLVTVTDYKLTSNSLGLALELNYDRPITKKLTLGIQASLYGGSISKITQKDASGSVSYSYSESLARFDLGIGIRF